MSKEVIRKLAEGFKVSHEAFNRAYELKDASNTSLSGKNIRRRKRILSVA